MTSPIPNGSGYNPLLPPQKPHTGRPAAAYRRILNGSLWIICTGAPWRDLPERYGCWATIASRFYRWRMVGIPHVNLVAGADTNPRAFQLFKEKYGAKTGVSNETPCDDSDIDTV